jgi:hypothetical protein
VLFPLNLGAMLDHTVPGQRFASGSPNPFVKGSTYRSLDGLLATMGSFIHILMDGQCLDSRQTSAIAGVFSRSEEVSVIEVH